MSSRYDGAILAAVDEYWAEYCRPPTVREVMALAGVSSTAVVDRAVRGLVAQGRLLRRGNGSGARTMVPLWVGAAVGKASERRPAAESRGVGDG